MSSDFLLFGHMHARGHRAALLPSLSSLCLWLSITSVSISICLPFSFQQTHTCTYTLNGMDQWLIHFQPWVTWAIINTTGADVTALGGDVLEDEVRAWVSLTNNWPRLCFCDATLICFVSSNKVQTNTSNNKCFYERSEKKKKIPKTGPKTASYWKVEQRWSMCWSKQREDDTQIYFRELRGQRGEQAVEEGQGETCQSERVYSSVFMRTVRSVHASVGMWSSTFVWSTLAMFLVCDSNQRLRTERPRVTQSEESWHRWKLSFRLTARSGNMLIWWHCACCQVKNNGITTLTTTTDKQSVLMISDEHCGNVDVPRLKNAGTWPCCWVISFYWCVDRIVSCDSKEVETLRKS